MYQFTSTGSQHIWTDTHTSINNNIWLAIQSNINILALSSYTGFHFIQGSDQTGVTVLK
jgi:hypothetical protein